MTGPDPTRVVDDRDLRMLLRLLDEDDTSRDALDLVLEARGWSASRVDEVVGRAVRSGWVFEDCRHDLQAAPPHDA